MDKLIFLQDLAIVMAISAVITVFCHQLRLPVVLGYIVAGIMIGPNTPPYSLVHDLHSIHTLAELGVILLLFSIGLEFSLTRLAKVGAVAFFAATVEIALMLLIGFLLGKAFGWGHMNSLFLGAILSISSTTIIAKILMDTKKIKEKFAQVILGILVIEDLLAILIIAVLSGIATTGSLELGELSVSMVKVTGFVLGVLFFGFLLVPKLLRYVERFESPEMMTITALGLCFGASLLAAKAGFSVALGAFLIGAVIAETQQVKDVLRKVEPVRDMFTAIFFVSVGMLLSPKVVQQYAVPIVLITLVTISGKVISCSVATFLTGHNAKTSLKVGLGLAQIGEFSFIIAMLGESSGVTSPFLYPIAVSVSGITALTTPLLMRYDEPLSLRLSRLMPQRIITAAGIYSGWIERIRSRGAQKSTLLQGAQPYLPRLLLYAFGIVSILYLCNRMEKNALSLPAWVYWSLSAVLVLPFILGFAHTLDRFLWGILRVRTVSDSTTDVNLTLQKSLRFLVSTATGILFFAGGIVYWPWWALAAVGLVLMAVSAATLWDSITKVHERVESTVAQVFDQEKPLEQAGKEEVHRELVRLIQEEYPLNVATEDFLLPFRESAVNQPIRDLGLRSHTGTTIVAIYRGEESIPNPPPETVLLPGDVLMLMGEPEQIKTAIKYLHEKAKGPPAVPARREGTPKTILFQIPPGSRFSGKTLDEIKLRRNTGATILGIQKEGLAISNPNSDTGLEDGDVISLFGWPDQLERAVEYLSNI